MSVYQFGYGIIRFMKKKRLALVSGVLSVLGLLALVGHHRQVKGQQDEEMVLKDVRLFFEGMGTVDVVYTTSFDALNRVMLGGVVFDDGVVFTYRYDKGVIDYKLEDD